MCKNVSAYTYLQEINLYIDDGFDARLYGDTRSICHGTLLPWRVVRWVINVEVIDPWVHFPNQSTSVIVLPLEQLGLGIEHLFVPLACRGGHPPHDFYGALCWPSILNWYMKVAELDVVLVCAPRMAFRLEHTTFLGASLALTRIELVTYHIF